MLETTQIWYVESKLRLKPTPEVKGHLEVKFTIFDLIPHVIVTKIQFYLHLVEVLPSIIFHSKWTFYDVPFKRYS